MTRPDRPDDPTQFRDDDPVARLIVHYFYPADMLRRDFQRAEARLRRLKGFGMETERQSYLYRRLWYAGLYTVVEGYKSVGLRHPDVDALLARADMIDRLRLFRNGTFHYQETPRKLAQLFDDRPLEALTWIEDLHAALRTCFDEYRMDIAVRNLTALLEAEKLAQ